MPVAPSPAAPPAPETRTPRSALPASVRFNKQLNIVADKARTKPELIRGLGGMLKSLSCRAMWIVTRGQDNQWSQPISILGDDAALHDVVGGSVQTSVNLVQGNRSLIVIEPQELPGHVLMAAPALSGELVSDVLIALFPTTNTLSLIHI